jgi:amino acid adenylation domain-containing protein
VTSPALKDAFVFPASFAQRRLWFLHQLDPASPVYNIPSPLRIAAPLDLEVLRRTLNEIVRRHEALRTTFTVIDGEPVQVVAPALTLPLEIVDLRVLPPAQREAEAQRLAMLDALRPFSLGAGPLIRATALRLTEAEQVLLLTLHHIVSDGWSMGILLRELGALYTAFAQGRGSPLPELPVQYADFASWQRELLQGEVLERHLGYWRQELAGIPELLDLPLDHARPRVQTHRGAGHAITLDPRRYDAIRALARQHQATPFMVMYAAFATLLYRLTGQPDIVVGSPIANRRRAELEGMIGLFVNTLVLRADLSRDPTFVELLARVRETTLDAFAHQDLPFERLVEELQPARNTAHNPLFQVMFLLQSAEGGAAGAAPEQPGLRVATDTAKFDLTMNVVEVQQTAAIGIEYNRDLFEPETIARIAERFEILLGAIAADPRRRVSELAVMSADERRQLVTGWNATEVPRDGAPSVPLAFVAQARRTPAATALIFEGAQVRYDELAARVEAFARQLRGLGVGPGERVALCVERSPELIVALLAILLAGGAYVPLDPEYPPERLAFMLADAAPTVLIVQDALAGRLPATGVVTTSVPPRAPEADAADAADASHDPPLPVQPAYVIYTSGSTGRPKGAVNTHRGLTNRMHWIQEAYPLGADDRVLHKTPTSFDVSIGELYWPLMTGATLVIARPGGHRDPDYLIDLIERERVTVAHFVPSMLRAMIEHPDAERCGHLRRILSSGEALPADLEARVLARLPATELLNLYGPTETAVEVTAWACRRPSSGRPPPIGRPIANTRAYVLDRHLEPAPIGIAGDLYIGGANVGLGYHERPGLTARAFLPDPFGPPGSRLYATGDRARIRSDGNLEFLGRLDHQVKIRGFRIELGEIEAALRRIDGVHAAAAIARERAPGDHQLIGYIVPSDAAAPPEELSAAAARRLRAELPDHMVPRDLVVLPALPLLPNGKLDLRALPAAAADRAHGRAHVAPRTPIEHRVAALFAELLGQSRIGIHDDFFELGGHSLLATRLVTRLHDALQVSVPLRRFFEAPNVEALAAAAVELGGRERAGAAPAIDRAAPTTAAMVEAMSDGDVAAMLDKLLAEGDPR